MNLLTVFVFDFVSRAPFPLYNVLYYANGMARAQSDN